MHPYQIIFTLTLLASLALVLSQRWHGRFSLNNAFDVQNHHTEPAPRIGGVAIALGLIALPALWAVAFANNTDMLALAFGCFVFGCAAAYARLTQFRRCFNATALKAAIA